jgi:hypothetical protein
MHLEPAVRRGVRQYTRMLAHAAKSRREFGRDEVQLTHVIANIANIANTANIDESRVPFEVLRRDSRISLLAILAMLAMLAM